MVVVHIQILCRLIAGHLNDLILLKQFEVFCYDSHFKTQESIQSETRS